MATPSTAPIVMPSHITRHRRSRSRGSRRCCLRLPRARATFARGLDRVRAPQRSCQRRLHRSAVPATRALLGIPAGHHFARGV